MIFKEEPVGHAHIFCRQFSVYMDTISSKTARSQIRKLHFPEKIRRHYNKARSVAVKDIGRSLILYSAFREVRVVK